jgi:hypothetical protein
MCPSPLPELQLETTSCVLLQQHFERVSFCRQEMALNPKEYLVCTAEATLCDTSLLFRRDIVDFLFEHPEKKGLNNLILALPATLSAWNVNIK